jgi:TonB family protein
MKARSLFFLSAGLVCSIGATSASAGYVAMKITQTEPVTYPIAATTLGLTTGEVQVSIQIDEKGELTDYLITGYTHKAFADRTVMALKKWHYEPAWLDGKPHSTTTDLTFSFQSQGLVVVDLTVNNIMEVRNLQLRSDYYGYAACTLSQLDRIPTPSKVVKPRFPFAPPENRKAAVVTVHFYIDQDGHVRMPAVSRETSQQNDQFAAEALAAISQWEFEPPLSKGKPVLVSAVQDFNFKSTP